MEPSRDGIVRIVCSRPALRRCVPTALVVGTILTAVNQGGVLLSGEATATTWVRVAANFAIPFVVSNVGYVGAARQRR